mgnify:CR=1 FL=1
MATALDGVRAVVFSDGPGAVGLGAVVAFEALGANALSKGRDADPLLLVGRAVARADVGVAVPVFPGRHALAEGALLGGLARPVARALGVSKGGVAGFAARPLVLALRPGERGLALAVDVLVDPVFQGEQALPVAAAGVRPGDGQADVIALVEAVRVPVGLGDLLGAAAAGVLVALRAGVAEVAVADPVHAHAVLSALRGAGSAAAGVAVPAILAPAVRHAFHGVLRALKNVRVLKLEGFVDAGPVGLAGAVVQGRLAPVCPAVRALEAGHAVALPVRAAAPVLDVELFPPNRDWLGSTAHLVLVLWARRLARHDGHRDRKDKQIRLVVTRHWKTNKTSLS